MNQKYELLKHIEALLSTERYLSSDTTAESVLEAIESYCRLIYEYTTITIDNGES